MPPNLRILLARPARKLSYPDFAILGESFDDVSGHSQIFRESFSRLEEKYAALRRLHESANKTIEFGIGGIHGEGCASYRTMSGAEEIEKRHGRISGDRWRLAVLRPLEVVFFPAYEPTPEDLAKAAEIGLEVWAAPEHWELIFEFALDVAEHSAVSP